MDANGPKRHFGKFPIICNEKIGHISCLIIIDMTLSNSTKYLTDFGRTVHCLVRRKYRQIELALTQNRLNSSHSEHLH